MKIGVNVSINVKDIEKARLVQHANGKTYLNMSTFIDIDNKGQYGDNGMITQDVSKEEKDGGVKGPILGNVKVFWRDDGQQQAPQQQAPQQPPDNFDDDIPF